ncbi:hypothetical protein SmJEL517_g01594 [Synchytrium microbalum]|uniref:Uncharacterized protein n=1 Tax=Synchytrium microbalum TaxID=1806994 RepID=A0A507C551_9FUNG|nr:uncharacterized protein SmJEL517_g01594 [Synchytrium microbalum]TPX36117.1 hypothetical protein SmJEL517_g01594 [Synchytrium microbalum]
MMSPSQSPGPSSPRSLRILLRKVTASSLTSSTASSPKRGKFSETGLQPIPTSALDVLPRELWERVISFVPNPGTSQDHQVRTLHLTTRYGRQLALLQTFLHHPRLLDPSLTRHLIKTGTLVPRFLAQNNIGWKALYDIYRDDVMALIQIRATDLYGEDANLGGNDIAIFEALTNDLAANHLQVREMIDKFGFIPMERFSPTAVFRLYHLTKYDISLLDLLIEKYGYDTTTVNNRIMHFALTNSNTSYSQIQSYLSRGFTISPSVIIAVLTDHSAANVVTTLSKILPMGQIRPYAIEVLEHQMGPNGDFVGEIIGSLIEAFSFEEEIIAQSLMNKQRGLPYRTRIYDQTHPYVAWKWILQRFGANHRFSRDCFSDFLMWLGELGARIKHYRPREDPWKLLLFLFDEGCTIEPHHFRFIARAALCPNSAPHMSQLIARFTMHMTRFPPTEADRRLWISTIRDEVVGNKEYVRQIGFTDFAHWQRAAADRRTTLDRSSRSSGSNKKASERRSSSQSSGGLGGLVAEITGSNKTTKAGGAYVDHVSISSLIGWKVDKNLRPSHFVDEATELVHVLQATKKKRSSFSRIRTG